MSWEPVGLQIGDHAVCPDERTMRRIARLLDREAQAKRPVSLPSLKCLEKKDEP